MGVDITPPRTFATIDYICDRCSKHEFVPVDEQPDVVAPPDPAEHLPDGWSMVRHPAPYPGDRDADLLVFNSRACMSVWFATYVRTSYGGPKDLPKRRSSKQVAEEATG